MVFDLEIQATDIPGEKLALRCVMVVVSIQLMNGPVVFHGPRSRPARGEHSRASHGAVWKIIPSRKLAM